MENHIKNFFRWQGFIISIVQLTAWLTNNPPTLIFSFYAYVSKNFCRMILMTEIYFVSLIYFKFLTQNKKPKKTFDPPAQQSLSINPHKSIFPTKQ